MTAVANSTRKRMRGSMMWFLIAALAAALFVSLGMWQLDRKAYKERLVSDFHDPVDIVPLTGMTTTQSALGERRFQPVSMTGTYINDQQLLLDNQGKGFHVWTPFKRADGTVVIVSRGWVGWIGMRQAPDITVDTTPRTITGLLTRLPISGVVMGASISEGPHPKIVVFPTYDDLVGIYGTPLQQHLILLDGDAKDGYQRDWKPVDLPPERHLGYAVQWFALALAVLFIYTLLTVRAARRRVQEGNADQ